MLRLGVAEAFEILLIGARIELEQHRRQRPRETRNEAVGADRIGEQIGRDRDAGRAARRGAIARIRLPEIIGEGVALLELVVILQIAAAEIDSEIVLITFGCPEALLDGIGFLLRLTEGVFRSDERCYCSARD